MVVAIKSNYELIWCTLSELWWKLAERYCSRDLCKRSCTDDLVKQWKTLLIKLLVIQLKTPQRKHIFSSKLAKFSRTSFWIEKGEEKNVLLLIWWCKSVCSKPNNFLCRPAQEWKSGKSLKTTRKKTVSIKCVCGKNRTIIVLGFKCKQVLPSGGREDYRKVD